MWCGNNLCQNLVLDVVTINLDIFTLLTECWIHGEEDCYLIVIVYRHRCLRIDTQAL